jgi:CDP-diacylglycerol--glycerol-3-phosphate 3-phosphatidyltransferase
MILDVACSVALAGALLALAIGYARRVARAGAFRHARVDRAGGSPLLAKSAMEMGYWALRPVARACVAARVTANAISWASLLLAAAAGLALAFGRFGLGAALGAFSAACDALDGMVARDTGTASDAGEVLDATIDRYAELLFLGGIALHERTSLAATLLALTALAGAVMVSYSTAKAEALSVEPPRGAMRRQERAVYLVLGVALVPPAAAAVARTALPAWTGELPLYLALALVGVVGNASAIRRLRAVAFALRRPGSGHARGSAQAFARDAHAAAGDVFR